MSDLQMEVNKQICKELQSDEQFFTFIGFHQRHLTQLGARTQAMARARPVGAMLPQDKDYLSCRPRRANPSSLGEELTLWSVGQTVHHGGPGFPFDKYLWCPVQTCNNGEIEGDDVERFTLPTYKEKGGSTWP